VESSGELVLKIKFHFCLKMCYNNNMKLTINERFALIGLINQFRGQLSEVNIALKMLNKITLSEAEEKEIGLKNKQEGDTQRLTWNNEKAKLKEVSFDKKEKEIISGVIEKGEFSVRDVGIINIYNKL